MSDRRLNWAIRVLIGQALLSRIAAVAELVALNWWVFHTTNSATMVGIMTLARLVPLIVAGPHLGALADRSEPTRLLAAVLAVGAVMTLACAGTMYFVADYQWAVWAVLLLVAARSTVTSAEPAIRNTVLARISGEAGLLRSMSSLSLALTTSLILGPGLAGALMAGEGPALVIAVSGLGFAISAVLARALPRQFPVGCVHARAKKSPWSEVLTQAWSFPRLGAQLVLGAGPMLCIFPYTAMLPILADVIFDEKAEMGIAYLSASSGVGAVTGALCLRFLLPERPSTIAFLSAALLRLPTVALSAVGYLPVAVGLVLIGVIGLVGQLYRTSNRAAVLLLAPEEQRGLFGGISQTDRVLIPAGALLFGVIADVGGVAAMAIAMAGANALLITPAVAMMTKHRKA